jgi:hypothetical protein
VYGVCGASMVPREVWPSFVMLQQNVLLVLANTLIVVSNVLSVPM